VAASHENAERTRDELVEILTEIIHATRARLSEARPGDGLKAAEMLAKMCGWNEPERVDVQSVEVKVDAALIEQLRAAMRSWTDANNGSLRPAWRPTVKPMGPLRNPEEADTPAG
jgi:hypothetical protein